MHRRGFLASAAGALLFPQFAEADTTSLDVNAFLDAFPEAQKIPDMHHIDKIRTENASHALVVLRGSHYVFDWEMSEQSHLNVRQSQLESYRVLNWLHDQKTPGLNHILPEEYKINHVAPYLRDWREEFTKRMRILIHRKNKRTAVAGIVTSVTDEDIQIAGKDESKLREIINGTSTLEYIGAAKIFAYNRNLKILPATNYELEEKAVEAVNIQDPRAIDKWVYRERELFLLRQAVRRKISYTALGATHTLKDTINEWNNNSKNEDKKFSAIILTTNAVKDV